MYEIDWQEVIRRALKYLFEGLAVGLAAFWLQRGAKMDYVLMVAITASSTFALLDLYAPTVGGAARLGSGLSIGGYLTGGF